jgi:phosphohistidine phosphatase
LSPLPTLASFREANLRLLLLRHAKSDWSGKAGDHERPLAARGRFAAPRIGAYMRKKGYEPKSVLCSTAARTRETLELVLPYFSRPPEISYDRSLYLAEWPQLLAEIRLVPADASPLLLVGHNPGLEQLAIALALQPQTAPERARAEKLAQKFPAGALAVLDVDLPDWDGLKPGLGELVDFVRPKDLGSADEDE